MAKVKCLGPEGHVFDTAIYGNTCPICNAGISSAAVKNEPPMATPPAPPVSPAPSSSGPHTHIGSANTAGATMVSPGASAQNDAVGATMISAAAAAAAAKLNQNANAGAVPQENSSRTMIRRPDGAPQAGKVPPGRKLVGFLVTYNRTPLGKAFPIYEGRNYVGRDASCDIAVTDDNLMSGRHMSILYRSVDNKFKFRDEQSSNGTFINKELLDEGELQNYDIVRVGSTLFIFVAIPQI